MTWKREPALIAAAIVAILNLVVGGDSGFDQDGVETLVLLLGGFLVRQKVTPVNGSVDEG